MYCDESVCLSVCLYDGSHISKTTWPNFTKFFVHVYCSSGSVLAFEQQCTAKFSIEK